MSDIQLNLVLGPEISGTSRIKPRGNRFDLLRRSTGATRLLNEKFNPDLAGDSDGQRIKARRADKTKHQKEVKETIQEKTKFTKSVDEQLPENNKKTAGESRKRKYGELSPFISEGNKPSGQVISSLFRFNPEIPQVKSAKIESIKEDVFSSEHFRDLPLHPYMVSNLEEKLGLKSMTSVQQKSIPYILQGRDVLVKSQTGSGKTLTFAVPIVQALQDITPKIQRLHGAFAVVVVPTRELATQCFINFQKLVNPFTWIVPGCLMGGEKRKAEKARLRKGINILVTTPGRLLDHLQHTQNLTLARVKWLVLDEADRLLDMGYEKDVAEIINFLNKETKQRQTIMLSATLTDGVERLAGITLDNPVHIDTSQADTQTETDVTGSSVDARANFTVPQNLRQHFVITPPKLRLVTLAAFITWHCKAQKKKCKMIVFMSTQDLVEFHYSLFQHFFGISDMKMDPEDELKGMTDEGDILFFKLHGEMLQKDRSRVFQEFTETDTGVLFCTDVAARGLDLPYIQWILQYTSPGAATDYVHRVGRTARAGKQGQSLLFLMPSEADYIQTLNEENIQLNELQMNDILKNLKSTVYEMTMDKNTKRSIPHTVEETATYLQMCFENRIIQNKSAGELSKKAFQSFIRAYSTYPSSLKHIFHIKKVHLGHLAKSFALREAPSNVKINHHQDQINKWKDKKKKKAMRKTGNLDVSEFGSGLSGGTLHKVKKSGKIKKENKVK